jgi:hypothetical protein
MRRVCVRGASYIFISFYFMAFSAVAAISRGEAQRNKPSKAGERRASR